MNLAEWHQVLAAEPATPNQVGAIQAEFGRLGVDDRAERLAITAALLGIDELGSTRQLVMGQAGQVIAILRGVQDRAGLPVPAPGGPQAGADDEGQDAEDGHDGVTRAEAVTAVLVLVISAFRRRTPGTGNTGGAHNLCGLLTRPCA